MPGVPRVIHANSATFAPRLTSLRERKRLSKKQLARKLRVSAGSVTMWEDASYGLVPSAPNLVKIAKFFDVTVEELIA